MTDQKKYLSSKEIAANMDELMKRKYLHFHIKGLTRDTRDLISAVVNGILEQIGADPLASFHLFSGLMEALLNGIKGNIKYTIFKNELASKLKDVEHSSQEIERLLQIIMDTSPPDKVKRMVQNILALEEKVRVKKQQLNVHDQDFLYSIRQQMKKENRKVSMKIRIFEDELYIRIKNDAPVMDADMDRINESRLKHNALFQEGRSSDYFRPDYLDEKESAGFGIAMIDEGYYNMGLNPLDYFTYTQSKTATTVYLTYPIEKLKAGLPF